MSLPIAAEEVYRLIQITRYNNVLAVMNTFHFGLEASGFSNANVLCTDWRDNIVPTWKANVGGRIWFVELITQRIAPDDGPLVSVLLTGTGALGTSSNLPSIAAGLITWRTQLTGRSRRGRSYIAGLPYDTSVAISDGVTWGTTSQTRLGNIANVILSRYTLGANPGGFFLCVWSRLLGGANVPRDPFAGAALVNRFTVQPYIGSMGTRRGFRGV
jgi:hypothetical protein